jgi:hypothetical protein
MKIPFTLPRQFWFALFGIGTVETRRAYLIGPTAAGRVKRVQIKRAMQTPSLFHSSITALVGFTGSGLVVRMDSEVIPRAQFQPAVVLFLAKIA